MGTRTHTPYGLTQQDKVVLDSWPVVEAAHGSQHATDAIDTLVAEQTPVMSIVNYAEVYCAVLMAHGAIQARNTLRFLRRTVELEMPTYERIMQAAHLKSSYYLALGDGFAAATALHHGAELWTGDTELVFDGSPWQARDLRIIDGKRPSLTKKEKAGKVGPRPRSYQRPADEPDIPLADLMTFLEGSLAVVDTHRE